MNNAHCVNICISIRQKHVLSSVVLYMRVVVIMTKPCTDTVLLLQPLVCQ